MGIYNSTKTRVEPVFQALRASGRSWLKPLLRLPSCGHPNPFNWDGMNLSVEEIVFGDKEKQLPAHPKLLDWLLENAEDVTGKGLTGCSPFTADKRKSLLARNASTIAEARRLLDADRSEKRWYVLEGPSCPDVYVSTPDLVVVIEGKRTEAAPTTATTWMGLRHQMLRHMDGALELANNRPVLGFFIVVGDGEGSVPPHWQSAAADTISSATLAGSLPHRSEDERYQLARGFLGVTTWQAVCREFGIEASELPDTV